MPVAETRAAPKTRELATSNTYLFAGPKCGALSTSAREQRLADHRVDAEIAVDYLAHAEIHAH